MRGINIEKTFNTPTVAFTEADHKLLLEGRMIPENAELIFKPITDFIDGYFADGEQTLHVVFRLYYYNTSSSKRIVLLMRKLDEYFAQGKIITARWEYEEDDDDCMNDGHDFTDMVKLPVEVVEISEME